jgi:hypothetical protein
VSAPNRNPDRLWLWVAAAVVGLLAAVGVVWGAVYAGAGNAGQPTPGSPVTLVVDLVRGTRAWPGGVATVLAIGVPLVVGALAVAWWLVFGGASRARVDQAAKDLARPRDLAGLTPTAVKASAATLRPGADLSVPGEWGVLLGVTLSGRVPLRMDWESVAVCIAGPRVGKSTSLAIPALIAAPGPAVATSNKADLHDATRSLRMARGRVWVFDPQNIAGTEPASAWWVNLLASVYSPATAERLAGHLADGNTDPGATPDAYFEPEGRSLLATYILAAAVGGGDLLHVLAWITTASSDVPHRLLAQNDQPAAAATARRFLEITPKQRDGLFGTAAKMIRVLNEPAYSQWVTPPIRVRFEESPDGVLVAVRQDPWRDLVPEFDPLAFVTSTGDTLYALSMEGRAAATSLTTALAAMVFDAGQLAASRTPARRLATPLVFVLDEAANVCRIRALPDLYSHFGSRGMPVITILQSWSQGCEVFGEAGMRKLWSAANAKLYLGGVSEAGFLRDLSSVIGDHDVQRWSTSSSRNGGSRSQSWSREPILSVAQLQALDRGRAVLLTSGNPPALIATIPWTQGPDADNIRASLAYWAPHAETRVATGWGPV